MCSASFSSVVLYLAKALSTAMRPHSVHSLRAMRSLWRTEESMMKRVSRPCSVAAWWISVKAVTALATTCGDENGQKEAGD